MNQNFVKHFEENKESDIKDHMRLSLSKAAGFGDALLSTNPIESANAIAKRWNKFEQKDVATFLGDVQQLTNEQQTHKSFNLPSRYVVFKEFRHKVVGNYSTLDEASKTKARESVKLIKIDPRRFKEVMSY